MSTILRTVGLAKTFGTRRVLDQIDFDLASGECVGVSGDPGCGRTTLLLVLATLMPPTSGSLEIDGMNAAVDTRLARAKVAYIPGDVYAPSALTAGEYLDFIVSARSGSTLAPAPAKAALERVGVSPGAWIEAQTAAMQRRLALEAVLSSGARVVLLDATGAATDHDREWMDARIASGASAGAAFVRALCEGSGRSACHRVLRLDEGRLIGDVTWAAARPAAPPAGVH